ncbi:hypothetical protein Fcan01_21776 [Folsomia candida]|uniref:Uncharacterized protein n=1 Tax=Folsomia candida TaxID=158441 RepID=A0A226DDT4_FOLCA|nr:hypothetical protein Fcan01_21776 [Folsomia candida]
MTNVGKRGFDLAVVVVVVAEEDDIDSAVIGSTAGTILDRAIDGQFAMAGWTEVDSFSSSINSASAMSSIFRCSSSANSSSYLTRTLIVSTSSMDSSRRRDSCCASTCARSSLRARHASSTASRAVRVSCSILLQAARALLLLGRSIIYGNNRPNRTKKIKICPSGGRIGLYFPAYEPLRGGFKPTIQVSPNVTTIPIGGWRTL